MKAELQLLISAERKFKRELQELRELRQKLLGHKNPDNKTINLIDDELKKYLEPK